MREALNAVFSIDAGNFNTEIRPAECFTLSDNPTGFACGKCNYILRSMPDTSCYIVHSNNSGITYSNKLRQISCDKASLIFDSLSYLPWYLITCSIQNYRRGDIFDILNNDQLKKKRKWSFINFQNSFNLKFWFLNSLSLNLIKYFVNNIFIYRIISLILVKINTDMNNLYE